MAGHPERENLGMPRSLCARITQHKEALKPLALPARGGGFECALTVCLADHLIYVIGGSLVVCHSVWPSQAMKATLVRLETVVKCIILCSLDVLSNVTCYMYSLSACFKTKSILIHVSL